MGVTVKSHHRIFQFDRNVVLRFNNQWWATVKVALCCFNGGPPSATVAHHWDNIGWSIFVYGCTPTVSIIIWPAVLAAGDIILSKASLQCNIEDDEYARPGRSACPKICIAPCEHWLATTILWTDTIHRWQYPIRISVRICTTPELRVRTLRYPVKGGSWWTACSMRALCEEK